METFIIAEAGVNHNGDVERAIRMVREAHAAGADAVKFQTFRAADLVTADAPMAKYQQRNDKSATQLEMLRRLELNEEAHLRVSEECHRLGIEFMSTPFSIEAALFLESLNMRMWKIPSGEITNLPLLECIARMPSDRVILSTGMATLTEVADAVEALRCGGLPKDKLFLLHCTTAYPTQPSDVNLRCIDTLRKFECAGVGYSDHTTGITIPVAAVAMGACIIEKHFTLDRSLPGPDHAASLQPDELREMVESIRTVEKALGSSVKEAQSVEISNMAVARKSIVAKHSIRKGEIFTSDNLTSKRPGTGISPMKWYDLLGKTASRDYSPDQQIDFCETDSIK